MTHPVDLPPATRTETDSLGSVEVPADAYWGVHTARALENFPISKRPISVYPDLVSALAIGQAGLGPGEPRDRRPRRREGRPDRPGLPARHRRRVPRPVRRRGHPGRRRHVDEHERERGHHQHRARARRYARRATTTFLLPIDDTNRSQSTNDVVSDGGQGRAGLRRCRRCSTSSICCAASFGRKGRGVPRRPEGRAHAAAGRRADDARAGVPRVRDDARRGLRPAHGEHLAALRDQPRRHGDRHGDHRRPATMRAAVVRHLSEITGLRPRDRARPHRGDERHRRVHVVLGVAQAQRDQALEDLQRPAAAVLRAAGRASARSTCPPRQAGSSIMPGKVNPVIPEVVNQVAFAVAGADVTVTMAVEGGQLQLNAFEPVIAHSHLPVASRGCARHAHPARELRRRHHREPGRVSARWSARPSASSPRSRRSSATPRPPRSQRRRSLTGRNVADLVVEAGLMTRDEVAKQLAPRGSRGVQPGHAAIPVIDVQSETRPDPRVRPPVRWASCPPGDDLR